ncbi:unnamed protein product (macronuclear) [Paramecium tetraurelia]|uniref:39S ribosomal protein L41, mitochondrial n=1 Tax=Paramecium tetraurelia TaxID=5888 RepID=A0E3Z3_PARTE|nr:uncharacterized protein GSPATT00023183001 [Paramecium tetraurelia]CAK90010.1 unnamed protein product [Paramecium tetraurelia]|eukprot:XP_001457407.1 hypothetical protein (macronuclear) [Paramecium tetraurelia strain d4-2]
MQSGFSVCRRKAGQTFRKTLGLYNYKLGHQQYHKEPGSVSLNAVEQLKNTKTYEGIMRIRKLRQESDRVFGKFVGSKFVVDKSRIPQYDIPDLTGFELKPYVSYHTPQVDKETQTKLERMNDFNLIENLVPRSETKLLDKK